MKIVLIGSGNIATHLAKSLFAQRHDIAQVYSKSSANAKALADVVGASFTCAIHDVNTDADLYIIAVRDEAISEIVIALPSTLSGIIVHTSGATDVLVLDKFKKYGVIYPPQSLNKSVPTDLSTIPFGIEGNNADVTKLLTDLMMSIAPKTFICDSKQRLALHISAVLVNNFSNALYQMAYDILGQQNLSFDLLKPIILETANKVQSHTPKDVQTGPAIRKDMLTINKHLDFLSHSEEQSKIYQYLSNFIINSTNK